MLVRSRSYGRERRMVRRGPQQVQFMKGCRYLRFVGSNSSRLQSSQMAMSGETKIAPLVCSLSLIAKPSYAPASAAGTSTTSTLMTSARLGGCVRTSRQKSSS